MKPIAAIILAAGASSRLGEPKQLVRLGGESLLERAVRVALEAGCAPVLVVLGARATEIQEASRLLEAETIVNLTWQQGMGSSIRAGLQALPEVDGAIVMTCDQPAVTASHLLQLIEVSSASGSPVGSRYTGRCGVPALFPKEMFPALRRLAADEGARSLLKDAESIELPLGEVDVDTPQALELARRLFPQAQ